MDKFEYKEEAFPGGTQDEWLAWINGQGQNGWEAIHFYKLGIYSIILFKRRLPKQGTPGDIG